MTMKEFVPWPFVHELPLNRQTDNPGNGPEKYSNLEGVHGNDFVPNHEGVDNAANNDDCRRGENEADISMAFDLDGIRGDDPFVHGIFVSLVIFEDFVGFVFIVVIGIGC